MTRLFALQLGGMKRIGRIFFCFAAMAGLTLYLMQDLRLVNRVETLSWEEFSSDPSVVARFRERAANSGENLGSAADVQRAYETYVASLNRSSAEQAGLREMGVGVAEFKSKWRHLCRSVVPQSFVSRRGKRANWWKRGREQVGMIIMVAALGIIIAGLSSAITALDRRVQR